MGAVVINEYLEGLVVSSASHTHTKSSALFCVVLVLVWWSECDKINEQERWNMMEAGMLHA